MIPLKLELTNFLSYRDTAVLDFDGIHLACIAGANGAGKSSILDGVTYALFGKSRSKSDDDLVNRFAARDGETATVRITFALEGTHYRVTRQKRASKGTALELQIETENGEWKILTESKVRETQAEIEKLLRMNYDTFINASFLLQGKADEFTTKTPNKRKEILADLLGLGQWELYKAGASERRKQAEGRVALFDAQLQEIENELAEEAEREAALDAAKENHTAVAARLTDKQTLLAQLRRTEAAIEQQKKHVQNLKTSQLRAETTLTELQQTQQTRQAERAEHETVLAEAEAIEADFAQWQMANETAQAWQEKADAYNALLQKKRPYELTIAQEESRLQQQQQELEAQKEKTEQVVEAIVETKQTLTAVKTRLAELTAALSALAEKEAEWHELRSDVQRLEGEQAFQQRELAQLQNRAGQMEKLQAEQTAVNQNKVEAEKQLATLAAEITAVKESKARHETLIVEKKSLDAAQERLRLDFKRSRERISQLEDQTGGDCPLCGQPLSEAHRQNVLVELQSELKTWEAQGKTNNERLDSLKVEIGKLLLRTQELPKLEQQQQTQQTRLASAEARLQEIENSLAEWQAEGQVRLAELETAVADQSTLLDLKEKLADLHTAVQQKAELEKERQTCERDIATHEAQIAAWERSQTQWQEVGQAELVKVSQRLEARDFDTDAQTALTELEAALTAVEYDPLAHTASREALQALAEAPKKQQQLQQARAAVKPLEDALTHLQKQIEEQTAVIIDLKSQQETAVAELDALTADGSDLRLVEKDVQTLREEEIQANRQVGVAQNRLAVLADQRERKQSLAAERTAVSEQVRRLVALEKAFGREGVQALLIEQAIPEIEERANELLDRLTGGEMQVAFNTQRQLKSRDALAETLDISIQDNAGERPYDNFSGGEQFRVNFAIRLALSQLLANRAGARLQTLVIDEGFGSQDPLGRQRLVEAINTISPDFKLILVITHIDELKDTFPTRIQVEKRPLGSTISIS